MNGIVVPLKRWSLLACLGLSLIGNPARAGEQIPFHSSGELVIQRMDSVSSIEDDETTALLMLGQDTGIGTVLGRYTSVYQVWAWPTVNGDGNPVIVYDGEFTSTTADGATLTAHLHAEAPPGATEMEAQATVIGGTGRLANVQGSWTSRARLTPTGFVYESFGTLSRPGRSSRR